MTATDVASQECGNTASGTGVSIITSSMKTRLALQHWLINTRFLLSMFCGGRAEHSQNSPPDWGRLEICNFSTDIVTRHVYCPCLEFNAFFLRNYSMKCQIGCLIEGMVANQLCRIVVGISSQICRHGHGDMGDVSTKTQLTEKLIGSMNLPGSNLCADTRRYKYLGASQKVKTERDMH